LTTDKLLREARKLLAEAMTEPNRMERLSLIQAAGSFAQRAFNLINNDTEYEVEIK